MYMQGKFISKVAALFVLGVFPASFTLADPPPGQDVSAQADRFSGELERQKEEKALQERKAPTLELEEEKEPQKAEPSITFTLNDLKISGSTIFPPGYFRKFYASSLGKTISFAELNVILEQIKDEYKNKGYATSTAYFPEQEIRGGIVELRVLEGKTGDVSIEGNKWFSSSFIENFFSLKKNVPLNLKKLQKTLLRVNNFQDLKVRAVVSPGKAPETSDIALKVEEALPYHAGISFDNQGTRLVGKDRTSFSLRSSNVSGIGDSAFSNTLLSRTSFGQSVSYNVPVGNQGTRAGLDMSYFQLQLGEEYYPLDIIGMTHIYTPRLSQELFLSERFEVTANSGLDIKSIKKKTGAEITTNDQLRLPYAGLDLREQDQWGVFFATTRFDFSTSSFLGASHKNHAKASRDGTGGNYFKWEASLQRIQKMPLSSHLLLRSKFQAASYSLPSSEQLQVGGANSVRGYPEGDYLADWGGVFNADWYFPCYLIPGSVKLPGSEAPLKEQLQPFVFFDYGFGQIEKLLPGEKDNKTLVGIGGGLKFAIYEHAQLRLEWATHLGDKPSSGNGPSTFYITFRAEI
ncbi:MAG: ShlB/FhaC/HecB family hemolysin secretion/activation protein [Candidatus Omnitrophica bacterium]|nr:ShlB/FhaC/HecB family hemolysin secretion/activation protein [Candidatus Omnitrophota bacterium]